MSTVVDPVEFGDLPEEIHQLASALVDQQRFMVAAWEPVVQDHITSGCRDVEAISRTLDWVLDCAGHPEGLTLYRRLCRYLWDLDQQAAAHAVMAYRAWWDPDDERPWRSSTSTSSKSMATANGFTPGAAKESTPDRILAHLRAKPTVTRAELAVLAGLSESSVKYHLAKLRARGVIRHGGSPKAGYWEVLSGPGTTSP